MNGGMLGFLFTGKDLASAHFARQNKNVRALATNSEAAAAIYERSMARMRKGAIMLGIAIVGLMAMTKVTKTFGEFQMTLASAGAVMHATANEMRVLERAAIDAGIATQFSPREAAEGLQALGAAGMNVAQSVAVLNPVLDLAAASMGQLGVAGAAENVVGVLNAFSMQADRAGEVADKLTRISQLTNFQFRDFGVAISQAAAQASTADQTFESMLATLGMLRNTNLAASASATAYREAVRRLSGDKRAHKELTKLHIDVLDKETNKIRDLGAIMADLAPKLEKLNSKEKNLRATRIFGVRGMKTYAAFVAQYNKLVKEGVVMTGDYAGAHSRLVSELGNAEGAAKKNRDALLATAEGQRLLLKGSWETTQIMMGKLALPVVLPALKALTSVLNTVIKLLDAIPKPMRSMIANFLGVGLAIKGVVGAFKMLQGVAGIAMLGRMAGAAADVGAAAGGASQKVGRLGAAMGKLRAGVASIGASLGRFLPVIGVGIAAMSALFAFMRQKEAEEMKRQKDIRRNNKLATESYLAAWTMAEKLRAATARSAETELESAKKNYGAARKVVEKFAAQHFEMSQRLKTARQEWLRVTAAQKANAATAAEVRKAHTKYIQLSGQIKAVNRAVIASEAQAAKFQLRRAKTWEDKQVFAARIVAGRFQKQEAMEAQFAKTKAQRLAKIAAVEGKERTHRQRAWRIESKQARRQISRYERQTARIAARFKLGQREGLQNRKLRRESLATIAAPRARAVAAPGARFMAQFGRWDRSLRAGKMPRMTMAMIPDFQRYLRTRGAEMGMKSGDIARLQQQAAAGQAIGAETGLGAGAVLGGAPAEPGPTPQERFAGRGRGGPAAPMGLLDIGTEGYRDLGRVIAQTMQQSQARVGPTIVNWTVDGDKIATVVIKATERGERQQDGVQTSEGGTAGAG
jgi:TP901 family phage tail tape measure protein